jgi:hypothetical protein
MHTSLRVIGVLPDLLVRVVLGFGFRRCAGTDTLDDARPDAPVSACGIAPTPM